MQTSIPVNMKLIDEIVGEAKIVSYGESSHGIQRMHEFNAELFKHLALNKGFRVMLFECSWEIMYKAEQYFADKDDSNLDKYCEFYLNAFDSVPSKELFKWIKKFNHEHPEDKIIIAGFQPEQPVADGEGLKKYFEIYKPEEDIIKVLEKHTFYTGNFKNDMEAIIYYWKNENRITPACRIELLKILAKLENFVEFNKTKTEPQLYAKTLCHIKSLIGYFGVIQYQMEKIFSLDKDNPYYDIISLDAGKETYNKGDRIRMQIFELQKKYVYPNKKILIWQHNFHAAKQSYAVPMIESIANMDSRGKIADSVYPDNPIVMSGVWLNGRYGRDFIVIGSVLPRTAEDNPAVIDYHFKQKYGENITVVDLKNKTDSPAHIDDPMLFYERSNNGYFSNFIICDQFDAVVYFPSSPRVDGKPLTGGR